MYPPMPPLGDDEDLFEVNDQENEEEIAFGDPLLEEEIQLGMPNNRRLLVFFTRDDTLSSRHLSDAEQMQLYSEEGITLPSAGGTVCLRGKDAVITSTITKDMVDNEMGEAEKLKSSCALIVPMLLTAAANSKGWINVSTNPKNPELAMFAILAGKALAERGVSWGNIYISPSEAELMQKHPALFQKAKAEFNRYLGQNGNQFGRAVEEARHLRQAPMDDPVLRNPPPGPI